MLSLEPNPETVARQRHHAVFRDLIWVESRRSPKVGLHAELPFRVPRPRAVATVAGAPHALGITSIGFVPFGSVTEESEPLYEYGRINHRRLPIQLSKPSRQVPLSLQKPGQTNRSPGGTEAGRPKARSRTFFSLGSRGARGPLLGSGLLGRCSSSFGRLGGAADRRGSDWLRNGPVRTRDAWQVLKSCQDVDASEAFD